MINQELVNFINKQRNSHNDEVIKNALLGKGWGIDDVEAAFVLADKPDSLVDEPLSPPLTEGQAIGSTDLNPMVNEKEILGFGKLLKASLSLIADHFTTIYGIVFIPLITFILISGLLFSVFFLSFGGESSQAFFDNPILSLGLFVLGLALFVAFFVVSIWSQAALIYAIAHIHEKVGIKNAFHQTKSLILPFFWVSILSSLVVFGASLLLIIPGIIVGVYIFASSYAMILDNKKGLEALAYSKSLVDGHWGTVFSRIIVFFLVYMLTGLLMAIIPIVNIFVGFLLPPFFMAFSILLYQNLKAIKNASLKEPKQIKKIGFVILIIIGLLIIPLIVLTATLSFSFISAQDRAYDSKRISDLKMMATQIDLDYLSVGNPAPTDIYSVPGFQDYKDPATGYPYEYTSTEAGDNYQICADLADHHVYGDRACIEAWGNIYSDDPFGPNSEFKNMDFDFEDTEVDLNIKDSKLNLNIKDGDSELIVDNIDFEAIKAGNINIDSIQVKEGSSTVDIKSLNINTETGEIQNESIEISTPSDEE